MSRKNPAVKAKLLTTYFGTKYNPANNFLSEMNILHSTKLTAVGGEVKLNDSNTKVDIGVSDFNGTQIATTENGFIDAVVIGYGKELKANAVTNPALVLMSHKRSDMPAWLLKSEIVLKRNGTEQFRMRVEELVIEAEPQVIRSEWIKELERGLKVEGQQDLEITLASSKGATMSGTHDEFISINLYGVKFSDRKTA
jgi:hypothetical protein